MRFVAGSAISLMLLGPQGLIGAPAEALPPVFRSDLELVKVTVTVRDAKGDLVTDLKPEDFVLFEDGRLQSLELTAQAADPTTGDSERESEMALDVGLLLDTSSSMEPVLKLSQQAAVRFLEGVPRARDLLTIFFDSDIRISRYDSEHQQGLFERIMSTRGADSTALYDAITVYLSRASDSRGRKVAVLFTDGQDTSSTVKFSELIDMVRATPVTIYSIGFQTGPPSNIRTLTANSVLRRLAEMSGGGAFFPTSYRDLPQIYERILEDLGAQYVLGFETTNKSQDGKFRKIKVQVKRPGLKIVHREGYFAAPPPAAAKN